MYYERINKKDIETEKQRVAYEAYKTRIGVIVGNDNEGEFILVPCEMLGHFIVTYVNRDDLNARGILGDKVTDSEMRDLAGAIENDLTENGNYWGIIEDNAKENNWEKYERVIECKRGKVKLVPSGDGNELEVYSGEEFDYYEGTIDYDFNNPCSDEKLVELIDEIF